MPRKIIRNAMFLLSGTLLGLVGCRGPLQESQVSQDLQPPTLQQNNPLPVSLTNRIVRVDDLPYLGVAGSPLALIEVTDYQCPFCQAHYRDILPDLKREFIETGRLKYYVLDYPIPGHELSVRAAVAASCAQEQQAYWRFHDALFERSDSGGDFDLTAIANDLELEIAAFEDCLNSKHHGALIESRRATALGLGVQGTPTFFLGRLKGQSVTDIAVLPGLQTFSYFEEVIGRYEN